MRGATARAAGIVLAVAIVAQASAATPPTRYKLPAGELRLSDSSVLAGSAAPITFSVRLERAVSRGSLALTLPRRWTQRSGVSGVAYAKLPVRGHGSSSRVKVARAGRVVTFAFTRARRGDSGSWEMRDVGVPAGTYRLPYRWREGTRAGARGTATVVFGTRTRSP